MRQSTCESLREKAATLSYDHMLNCISTLYRPVKPEQLSKDSSIILLAIFDYDTIWSNDFAGLCVVPCTSTPIEGTEPKIEHLYLFQYKKTDAYKELELRHTDVKAHDFLKYMKKFVC